jgi:hypothetical protein
MVDRAGMATVLSGTIAASGTELPSFPDIRAIPRESIKAEKMPGMSPAGLRFEPRAAQPSFQGSPLIDRETFKAGDLGTARIVKGMDANGNPSVNQFRIVGKVGSNASYSVVTNTSSTVTGRVGVTSGPVTATAGIAVNANRNEGQMRDATPATVSGGVAIRPENASNFAVFTTGQTDQLNQEEGGSTTVSAGVTYNPNGKGGDISSTQTQLGISAGVRRTDATSMKGRDSSTSEIFAAVDTSFGDVAVEVNVGVGATSTSANATVGAGEFGLYGELKGDGQTLFGATWKRNF